MWQFHLLVKAYQPACLTAFKIWHFHHMIFFPKIYQTNKNIDNQAFKFMFWRSTNCFSDRQQHSEMDVGRERSTWGEYLHSLTVRVSMIFNLPFSHVVSLTTPTLCEVWKSAAIHSINPTLQLVSYVRPPVL